MTERTVCSSFSKFS